MSNIPSSAMKHAHVHHDEPPHDGVGAATDTADVKAAAADKAEAIKSEATTAAKQAGTYVERTADSVVETVRTHPKTAIAVGGAVLAGVAAAVLTPLLRAKPEPKGKPDPKAKHDDKPKSAPKPKPGAKHDDKPGAKKHDA